MSTIKRQVMGGKSAGELFKEHWEQYGFNGFNKGEGTKTTAPVQRVLSRKQQEKQDVPEDVPKAGYVRKRLGKQMQQKDLVDSGEVSGATPLVFDPEIISILKQNAPLLDIIPMEGQQGFSAKYNIITSRTSPLGFTSESDAADLTNNTAQDVTFTTNTTDMQIYVDLVDISDFSQAAAEHYMNVEDTVLGERVALHAQRKAQQILYGDNSQSTGTGYLGDSDSYDGLNALADAGNVIDKSGTSDNFIKDIKGELASMKQNENINVNNLVMVTSYEFFDILANEVTIDGVSARPTADFGEDIDVGVQSLRIDGVPLVPTHNVDSYTDGSYTPGDPGDVFIFSTRAIRFRALVPFSVIPLAKQGLSERSALFEFGALIDKSDGDFIRHLQAYNF